MSKTLVRLILTVFVAASFSASVFSAPVKPVMGGTSVLSNFNQIYMPATSRISPASNYAFPTNKWWTSVYTGTNGTGSFAMSLGPTTLKFGATGAVLGAPILVQRSGAEIAQEFNYPGSGWASGYLQVLVATSSPFNGSYINNTAGVVVTNYSDWGFTAEYRDATDPSLKMDVTCAKGSPFVWLTFSDTAYPNVRLGGAATPAYITPSGDGMIISQNGDWFAVFSPPGTTYAAGGFNYWVEVTLPPTAVGQSNRYFIMAWLGRNTPLTTDQANGRDVILTLAQAEEVFAEYHKYAYNMVTNTAVSWRQNSDSSVSTTFNYTLTPLRTDDPTLVQGTTLFTLYPHQWRNLDPASSAVPAADILVSSFTTLRGVQKLYEGNSFTTRYNFNGMLPFLTYEVVDKTTMGTLLAADKSFDPGNPPNISGGNIWRLDTYNRGKAVAKAANLIPILHQYGDIAGRDAMISKLRTELNLWYTAQSSRYFGYDAIWGGIIGYPLGTQNFGTERYNDHHFHFGYWVYASAILAMYDPNFASSSSFKDIVDALISDYENPDRTSQSFPFLRNFDVYEGHSWANGTVNNAKGDDGIDQESSSEAMNSWAAIYLWGVATNNQKWIDLGIYGYATETASIQEYYFDTHHETFPASHVHRGGIVFDNSVWYNTWWSATDPQEIMGIWLLPLTPAMLYLGYDVSYAQWYYNLMLSEANQNINMWRDIWIRFESLFDAPHALIDFGSITPSQSEEGSSLSLTYQFINFFNALGNVNTDYYAVDGTGVSFPFQVMKNPSGAYTFITYNNNDAYVQRVEFRSRGSNSITGVSYVPPKTMAETSNFVDFKFDNMSSDIFISTISTPGNWTAFIAASTMTLNSPAPNITMQGKTALPMYNPDYRYIGSVYFSLSKTPDTTSPGVVNLVIKYSPSVLPNWADENNLRLATVDDNGNVTVLGSPDTFAHAFNVDITNNGFNRTYLLVYMLNSPQDIKVFVYPNPYRPSRGSAGIRFTNLKAGADISVYNISGEKVFNTQTGSNGEYLWNVTNNSGAAIASGVYVYYIKSDGKIIKGKLAIER